MLHKSKIDWCDFSWNPVTGCRHGCEYCYARKNVHRFSGDVKLNLADKQLKKTDDNNYILKKAFNNGSKYGVIPYPAGFEPTFHEYRLNMPSLRKTPANIFVCSMADLFGEWVPDEWIEKVFAACEAAPQHNYLFLTKNPERYSKLARAKKLPRKDNFWYGSTITNNGSKFFSGYIQYNTFLSIEPLLEKPDLGSGLGCFGSCDWVIVGAETGNRPGKVTPEREWIEDIIETAKLTQIEVYMKDSKEMRKIWGDKLIQEMPEGLRHAEASPKKKLTKSKK